MSSPYPFLAISAYQKSYRGTYKVEQAPLSQTDYSIEGILQSQKYSREFPPFSEDDLAAQISLRASRACQFFGYKKPVIDPVHHDSLLRLYDKKNELNVPTYPLVPAQEGVYAIVEETPKGLRLIRKHFRVKRPWVYLHSPKQFRSLGWAYAAVEATYPVADYFNWVGPVFQTLFGISHLGLFSYQAYTYINTKKETNLKETAHHKLLFEHKLIRNHPFLKAHHIGQWPHQSNSVFDGIYCEGDSDEIRRFQRRSANETTPLISVEVE